MPRMIFALRGMLEAYPMAQLVEEVLVAWNELMTRNEEVVGLSQRVRVLELDLADREDGLSPERAALEATEQSLREKETQAIHLERLLQDARTENEALRASQSAEDVEALRSEVDRLNSLASEQDDVIAELEVRLDEVVDALERLCRGWIDIRDRRGGQEPPIPPQPYRTGTQLRASGKRDDR